MKDKYSLSVADNILYAKRNIVDSIYTEARLEGVAVTYPDTQELYEGRTIAGLSIEDTIKVNNLKHAWQFILDNVDYPLSLRFIRQVNSEIGNGIVLDAGNIRMSDVKIGGTSWKPDIPDEVEIHSYLDTLLADNSKSTTQKAIETMLYIMRSQMFMDGNKRTAQLVANKIMISGGAGIISIPVDKQRDFITHLIDFYETGDNTKIASFVYENCVDGCNSSKGGIAITPKRSRR